ncbi:MAG: hypothetical protein ACOC5T_04585 [Elusimicrobiota bacterium]
MKKEESKRVQPKFKSKNNSYRPLDYPSREFGDDCKSGWVCPICDNIWSPYIDHCLNCSDNSQDRQDKDIDSDQESIEK